MKLLNKFFNFLSSDCDCNGCSTSKKGCTGLCNQGRNCTCQSINFSEAIIAVHTLASKVPEVDVGRELREIGNRLTQIGNAHHERQYNMKVPQVPQENRETFTNNSVYNYDGLEGTNH